MRKLLEFIRSVYVVVLFVVLEAIAISYYAHSTYYTQARLLARSNQLVGGVHGLFAGVRHYFSLGRENRELLAHVARMKERLHCTKRPRPRPGSTATCRISGFRNTAS